MILFFVQIIHLIRDPRGRFSSVKSSNDGGWDGFLEEFGETCRLEVDDLKVAADIKREKYAQ